MVAGTACKRELGTVEGRRYEKAQNQFECCSVGGREMAARTGTWNLWELRTGGRVGLVW